MIGFYTNYRPGLAAFAGLRLAALADELHDKGQGPGCSVMAATRGQAPVHDVWDRRVLSSKRLSVVEWLGRLSKVVWVGVPSYENMLLAAARGVCSIVYLTDDRLMTEHAPACRLADVVVSPSWQMTNYVKECWGVTDAQYAPWDPNTPVVKRNDVSPAAHIVMTVPRRQSFVRLGPFLDVCSSILSWSPRLRVTLLFTKSGARKFNSSLRRTADASGGRLRIEPVPSWADFVFLVSSADLVVCSDTRHATAVGLYTLTALTAGVPVVVWDSPVTREYVYHGTNGVLVPVRPPRDLGSQAAVPDLRDLQSALARVLRHPGVLKKLRDGTSYGLSDRRKLLVAGWKDVWK